MQRMQAAPVPAEASGSRALRAAGFAISVLFRAIPEKHRFTAAIRLARAIQPLIARTRGYQHRSRLQTDSLRETTFELLLVILTRNGTTFPTPIRVEGAEHLPAPGAGATLIVGPHTMLSTLFIRFLEDRGLEPFIISANAFLVPGTKTPVRVLLPSPQLLLKVRGLFREGRTIAAMIDRGEPERRNRAISREGGPLLVSYPLLRLAVAQGVRVIFIATRLDTQSRVVVRLSVPRGQHAHVDDLVSEFAEFVELATEQRTVSGGVRGATSPI
jgi:hypothetical protein